MGQEILPLEFSTDFECANAVLKKRGDPAHFQVTTRPDGAVNNPHFANADYYCAFRLYNPNPAVVQAQIAIEVRSLGREGRSLAVRRRPDSTIPGVEMWQPLPPESTEVDETTNTTRFRIPALPLEALDVSTMGWLSVSEVYAALAGVRERHPMVTVRSIGETPGGRWIPAVEVFHDAAQKKPLLCIGATNQSHELGTIATLFLVLEVLEGNLRELPRLSRLVFLPLTNPDGNALGTCMTNALRQNLQFGYGEEDRDMPAECAAIWNYLAKNDLSLYLELHSYPHLNRPSFRPYVWDLDLYRDTRSREIAQRFYSLLDAVSPPRSFAVVAGTDMEKRFRTSLVSRLIRRRGIPATLYKLHNRETVGVNCAQAALLLSQLVREMNWG